MSTMLVGVALATAGAAPAKADPTEAYQQQVGAVLAKLLRRYHLSAHAIDDELGERWLHNYLRALDADQSVFLQLDIDEFEQHRAQLDDDLLAKPPRFELLATIHQRYQQRLRERLQAQVLLLDHPLDLTDDESYVRGQGWPAAEAEAEERWRQWAEDEVIGELVRDTGARSAADVQLRLRQRVGQRLEAVDDVGPVEVLDGWLDALAASFDPHTSWLAPPRRPPAAPSVGSVGVGLSLRPQGEYVVITDLAVGGPAGRDGRIRSGDRLLEVGESSGAPVDIAGLPIEEVVRRTRGPEGSPVTLGVEHVDGTRETVDLLRAAVAPPAPFSARLERVGGHQVGVVGLASFYVGPNSASADLRREFTALAAQGAEGAVLDLRGNGGGSLVEALDVAGLFLPGGPVVQLRDRKGEVRALSDPDRSVAWSGPLVVLTDSVSTAASEIVAGALQDYGRAVIVGDQRTRGEGTVQQIVGLDGQLRGPARGLGGQLKITVQQCYRVTGTSIQLNGVTSDVPLPSRWDGLPIHESDRSYPLPADAVPPVPHVLAGDDSAMLPELRSRSAARVAESPGFQRLERQLAERGAEAQPAVSLVLERRRTEGEERAARIGDPDPSGQDFVLDEAVAVLGDLLDL